MDFLPFRTEYAKSGRAACKKCKAKIDQGQLRLARLVQSPRHDGQIPNWYHENCFFEKQRPQSEGEIEGFEGLKLDDQRKLRAKIEQISTGVVPSTGKGKGKGKKRGNDEENILFKDYGVEMTKIGRAMCRVCQLKILKDDVRIKKMAYDTEHSHKYGAQAMWYHDKCFADNRKQLGWFESAEKLPGFQQLPKGEKENIKVLLPTITPEDTPAAKKPKTEDKESDSADKELLELVEQQSEVLFKNREFLKNEMKKLDVDNLFYENNMKVTFGDLGKYYDLIADALTFGAIRPCEKCGEQFVFSKSGYVCTGNATEWAKCLNQVKEPIRAAFAVPKLLLTKYPYLKDFQNKAPQNRAIRYIQPKAQPIVTEIVQPKIKKPMLKNLHFVIIGLKDTEKKLVKAIVRMGGRVQRQVAYGLAAIISTEEEVKKMGEKMQVAKEFGIHVVPEDFVTTFNDQELDAISYIESKSICDWGTDTRQRVPNQPEVKPSKSGYMKSVSKSAAIKAKGGIPIDPDSGLEDVAHVYVDGSDIYNVVLGLTDIQTKKNSFYKIQLLERDFGTGCWLFRSWGRIGTTIGGKKLDSRFSVGIGIREFQAIYAEKTGNNWNDRHNFKKVPGLMYPVEVEYGEKDEPATFEESTVESKLPKPVQDVIKMMFDISEMKKVMSEFNLDMEKMPLGKLSQAQIKSAYKVLTEISELITNNGTDIQFIDATNRFYTLIPHSFGISDPPLLNSMEKIQHHIDLLDSLMQIECAYRILNPEVKSGPTVNQIDQCYEKLQTELVPLDRNTEEFKLLEKYVNNTHGCTHYFKIEIIDIMKVKRAGEEKRYKKFKNLHNRKLLWHGSRLTNFAGILSNGLKIAPPEAPVNGYMFGKGVYFADMVSKSAGYCYAGPSSPNGLMLLSEVALGDMLKCQSANFVTKLPDGKSSTLGVGNTFPNPKESHFRDDGVEIPLGEPIRNDESPCCLCYNEFIVYDAAQINIQYLLRMNFKYGY